jgi:hypothetical protein
MQLVTGSKNAKMLPRPVSLAEAEREFWLK